MQSKTYKKVTKLVRNVVYTIIFSEEASKNQIWFQQCSSIR